MTINETKSLNLSNLEIGEKGVITKILGRGAFRKRITEMGFVKGKTVKVIKKAPLNDPIEYEIMDYIISLRNSEAELIEIAEIDDEINQSAAYEGVIDDNTLKTSIREKTKTINAAFVGNPNSGKTTLFNFASGSRERVGNYSGVTVDAKEARINRNGYRINIVDLPGTYSITEYSPEELYVRSHIMDSLPDIVVNVIDASNLERNLFLTTQLIDMNIKVVIALNMFDELEAKQAKFDYQAFGAMIGIPIIPTVGSKGKGVDELLDKIIQAYEDEDPVIRHIHINYGNDIESAIKKLQVEIRKNPQITDKYSSRYLAIKLLENDKQTANALSDCQNFNDIVKTSKSQIAKLEKEYADKSETIIANAKYGFIAGALAETYKEGKIDRHAKTNKIDYLLTHKYFGFPIFLFFMWLMFQSTFSIGKFPMDWIDSGVNIISAFLQSAMPEGALKDMIIDGIIKGVGGVIIFLPNIMILFFFISLMEDTGYMARAAFIMDRLMHKIGLHGKSFIPLVMGFGCNVPAIMATRTLENKKDRALTMLIIPFMSCSARLPVYILLISAFFPFNQGLVLFSIYFLGIALAVIAAVAMKKTIFSKQEAPFVMELPPYRIPTLKSAFIHMWDKGSQYLRKMGTIILTASIVIWALGYYPRSSETSAKYESQIESIKQNNSIAQETKNQQISELDIHKEADRLENSYIGRIGRFIEPTIKPIGFDWKIGVSIITGMAAKEIVVSSMGILYQADNGADENSSNLKEKLQTQTYSSGERQGDKVFNQNIAYALMVFVLIYFPCAASIAAIKKESSWKWAIFAIIYTTSIAWIAAFIASKIGMLFFH